MAYAIDGVEPHFDENIQIDGERIFRLSKAHGVANIVGFALEQLGLMPPELAAAFKKERLLAMRRTLEQEHQLTKICAALQEKNIRYMLHKGCVIKQLYPSPDMRTMCDIDLEYDTVKLHEVEEILTSLGFEKGEASGTGGVNISFIKKPFVHIELHGVLMDTDIPLYNAYFGTGFKRAVSAGGSEMKFTDEDFFVFMAAHTAKHYFIGGTGLRSIADMWLYFRKKSNLDSEYIFEELKKIRLDEFVKTMLEVARVLFEGAVPNERQKNIISYIAESGTYGTARHHSALGLAEQSKSGYIRRRLFPSVEFMAINYPIVKKCVLLLPLFWVIRLISALFGKGFAGSDVDMVMSLSDTALDARSIKGNPFLSNQSERKNRQ